jgi:hypothetical protein
VVFGVATKSNKKSLMHVLTGIVVLAALIATTVMLWHRLTG